MCIAAAASLPAASAGGGGDAHPAFEALQERIPRGTWDATPAVEVREGGLTLAGIAVGWASFDYRSLPLLEELGALAQARMSTESPVAPSGVTWGRFSFPWLTLAAYALGAGLLCAGVVFTVAFLKLTTPKRKRRYVA
jgi:hypothetical protein